jgi:hypothetical protein
LLDDWAPKAKRMSRDESLAELANRYFTSRGPATLRDFAWWSGLTMADASGALELAKPSLARESFNGQSYWLASSTVIEPLTKDPSQTAYLLPAFDEYTVAYKDRSAAIDPAYSKLTNSGNGILSPVIVVDGRVAGTWKRTLMKNSLAISQSPFTKLKRAETRAITEAAIRYGNFLGASLTSA